MSGCEEEGTQVFWQRKGMSGLRKRYMSGCGKEGHRWFEEDGT